MDKRPSAKQTALIAAIVIAVVVLDQLAKYLARVHLSSNEVYLFLPGVLEFQLHMNDGASLGMLGGSRGLLVAVSAVASVGMAAALLLYKKFSMGERVSVALILGGAVGNLIDRAASGLVTDMLFFPWIGKIPLLPDFVCNVADVAITFGVVALIVCFIVEDARERKLAKSVPASEGDETGEEDDG